MALSSGGKGCLVNTLAGTTAAEQERIAAVLEQVGLLPHLGALAGTLAHGQKQWLEIAMLLVQSPTLLLLDEPVAGGGPAREGGTRGEPAGGAGETAGWQLLSQPHH